MNNKTKLIPIALFLSALMMLISCQKQKAEWKGTIEEVDGVTIVKNPKEPMYGEDICIIEEELSIGEAEGPEEYMFSVIRGIEVDDKENIYVVDRKGNHIRKFDKNGSHIRTIGREGQGPGEFQQITNIQITPEHELMVHDRYARRLTFFSLDGDYLRTALLKEIQASVVKVNSMRNYLVKTFDFDSVIHSSTFRAATELKVYSSDLAFIRTIAKDKFWSTNVPLQPRMALRFLPSDLIICGFRESYNFQILDSEGKTIQKISRDYVPIEISKEEKKKMKLPQSSKLPRSFPAFQDFSVDEEGRIFVQTYERQIDENKFYYDIFDPKGRYLAKIPLKMKPLFWKKDKLYTIDESEEGFQFVKRYKVTWKY
jgi:hypothetical protein